MKTLKQKREHYYKKKYIQYELLRAMRDKEVIFMDRKENWKCIRGMFIRNLPILNKFFNEFHFFDKDYNIYVSCSHYRHIPYFITDLTERSKKTSVWFEKHAREEIFAHDLLMDLDTKDLKKTDELKLQLLRICHFLDEYEVCYWFYPSGNNFQLVLDSTGFKEYNQQAFMNIAKNIKNKFNLTFFDLKGIGVFNKIRKCEYSLVENKVILPILTKNKEIFLENIAYTNFESDHVLGHYKIQNRGILKYNDNEEKENLKNMTRFLISSFVGEK